MININKKICENIEGHSLRIKHGKILKKPSLDETIKKLQAFNCLNYSPNSHFTCQRL